MSETVNTETVCSFHDCNKTKPHLYHYFGAEEILVFEQRNWKTLGTYCSIQKGEKRSYRQL